MPLPGERRAAIDREVAELERLVVEGERHLRTQDWNGFAVAMRDARRVRHALVNAMQLPAEPDDDPGDAKLRSRVRRIFDAREAQLERLRAEHADVAERLNVLARWKTAARASVVRREPRRGTTFESLQ